MGIPTVLEHYPPRMRQIFFFIGIILVFVTQKSFSIEGKDSIVISNSDPLAYGVVLVVGKDWTCTGTLISPDLVVTAAHCIYQPDGTSALDQQIFVHLGSIENSNYSEDGRWMMVKDIKVHETFTPNNENEQSNTCSLNDIALLKVDPDGLSDKSIARPVKISKNISDLRFSKNITVYGITSSLSRKEYPTLRSIMRPKRDFIESQSSTCIKIDWPSDRFDSPDNYTGLVHGDSGGPGLLHIDSEIILVGVDSGGDSYTALALYSDWIISKAKELKAISPK